MRGFETCIHTKRTIKRGFFLYICIALARENVFPGKTSPWSSKGLKPAWTKSDFEKSYFLCRCDVLAWKDFFLRKKLAFSHARVFSWVPRPMDKMRFQVALGYSEKAREGQCVAVCCSVLQYVAVSCSELQCVAVCCSVLQCVAACCSMLQWVAVSCSVLQREWACYTNTKCTEPH